MAEEVRFELTEPVKVQRFSRPPHSTTLPPLRNQTHFSNPVRHFVDEIGKTRILALSQLNKWVRINAMSGSANVQKRER